MNVVLCVDNDLPASARLSYRLNLKQMEDSSTFMSSLNFQYPSQQNHEEWAGLLPPSHCGDVSCFTDADSANTGQKASLRILLQTIAADPLTQQYLQASRNLLHLSPGDSVIEVGCGSFPDLEDITRSLAPSGRVVGIDKSEAMMASLSASFALLSAQYSFMSFSHHQQDACHICFPDHEFNAARAVRVLQYCSRPDLALQEMKRVVQPGGRIVVVDPDWSTFSLSNGDNVVTEQLTHWVQDLIVNPRMGAELPSLFSQIGLTDIGAESFNRYVSTFSSADVFFMLSRGLQRIQEHGYISAAQADQWSKDVAMMEQKNTFQCKLKIAVVGGTIPTS